MRWSNEKSTPNSGLSTDTCDRVGVRIDLVASGLGDMAAAVLAVSLSSRRTAWAAYYLKEELRLFWEQKNRRKAAAFLEGWIRRAESTSIRMLHQFAKTLRFHRSGLLSFYRYPISTGPLEGTNNKIKTMKRMAYGFRDYEFFKLKIYALHEARYALVG
jgi:transposase